MNFYKTVCGESAGEITVERSRFIAAVAHVESEEQAAEFIAQKRARYHDAKHNCFAYNLQNGISRYGDDGEPHGTAGKPMLDIINGLELYDTAVVVTRYFGGVLLGTGGLVRAYSSAAKLAAENAEIALMQPCTQYKICCAYSDFDYAQKTVLRFGKILLSDFGTEVMLDVAIKKPDETEFLKTFDKLFMGRYKMEKTGDMILPL